MASLLAEKIKGQCACVVCCVCGCLKLWVFLFSFEFSLGKIDLLLSEHVSVIILPALHKLTRSSASGPATMSSASHKKTDGDKKAQADAEIERLVGPMGSIALMVGLPFLQQFIWYSCMLPILRCK